MPASCPVCGSSTFKDVEVLWDELISDWQLSPPEVGYINRQQGFYCTDCGNNLRSMALADAILFSYKFSGALLEFVETDFARSLKVLEINEAGSLTPILKRLPHHSLVCYPEYDMTCLSLGDASFDLVVHSDTLEHVPNPIAGLSECRRVLVDSGRLVFTVPTIIGRFTRSRSGLKNSYHGNYQQLDNNYVVQTEFGADMWRFVLEAGFASVRIHSFEYPSGLAVEATTSERQT